MIEVWLLVVLLTKSSGVTTPVMAYSTIQKCERARDAVRKSKPHLRFECEHMEVQ